MSYAVEMARRADTEGGASRPEAPATGRHDKSVQQPKNTSDCRELPEADSVHKLPSTESAEARQPHATWQPWVDPQAAAKSGWAAPQCQNRGSMREDDPQKENQRPENNQRGQSRQMGQPRHGPVATYVPVTASTKSFNQTFNPSPATYRFSNLHSPSQFQPHPKKRHLANFQANVAKKQKHMDLHSLKGETADRGVSACTLEATADIGDERGGGQNVKEKVEEAATSPGTSEGGVSGGHQDAPQTSSGGDGTYATLSAAAGKLSSWNGTSVVTCTNGDLTQASPQIPESLNVGTIQHTPHPPPRPGPEGMVMMTPAPGQSCASPYTVGLLSNKKTLLPFQLRYKNLEAVLRDRETQLCYGSQAFQALQQMAPAARKERALELEKKVIQMALEEAREMKRVRRLAIMSRRLPMDVTPSHANPAWQSPTDLRIAHKAGGGGNSLLYKFEAWVPRTANATD